ncbi:MAG: hypothetical protein RMY33_033325 [Nostoc sp. DedQUE03]|nr:hypothetical protein [Nostoc sp. DedQUE02]
MLQPTDYTISLKLAVPTLLANAPVKTLPGFTQSIAIPQFESSLKSVAKPEFTSKDNPSHTELRSKILVLAGCS